MSFNILGYILFAFATSISPGPNNILLFSSGKQYGFRQSLPLMLGIAFGFFTLLYLSGYGVSIFISQNPTIELILKIVSTLWLLYLAYIIKDIHKVETNEKSKKINFYQAYAMQFINPKAWVMAINGAAVFMPQFESIHLNVFIFALIFIIVGVNSMVSWVLLGNIFSKIINSEKGNKLFSYFLSLLMVITIISIWI